MKHRVISCVFAIILLFLCVFPAYAAAQPVSEETIIYLDNGDYIKIYTVTYNTRAANTCSGQDIYEYYNSNDILSWKAVLTATFTYTGTSATCTGGSCSVTIYDDNWYEASNVTTIQGNAATTALTMGRKMLGVTVLEKDYTLRLTCDKYGILHG